LDNIATEDWQVFERALQFVAGDSDVAGPGPGVDDLLKFLCDIIDVDYAVCSITNRDAPGMAQSISAFNRGRVMDNFEYDFLGAPCEGVLDGSTCIVPDQVQELFPLCNLMTVLNAASYAGVPLRSSDGSVLGLIAVCDTKPLSKTDLIIRILQLFSIRASSEVERLRGVNSLILEQRRSADFASISSEWYWETDAELRFSYISDLFESTTGIPPKQLIGKTREEIGAPGATPEKLQELIDTMRAHRPFQEFVHYRDNPEGRRVYVSISAKPIFDENGAFTGYRGIGRDVTAYISQSRELKRLADQAEADNRMILRVINGIPALISYIDRDHRFVFGNWAYRDWYGIDPDTLPGRKVEDVHEGSLRERAVALLERGLAGETVEIDLTVPVKDGRVIEIEGVLEPDRNESGEVQGVYVFAKDLTETREAYRALHSAEIAARRSDRAKSQFLANMSHELRSPLNSIIGYSEMMALEYFGPLGDTRYKEYASGIGTASKHLLDVISDILDLSKVEAGAFDVEEEVISVKVLAEGAMTLVKQLAAAKNQSLIFEGGDESPTLAADERLLRQVLVNLLSNAIKFSPEESEITISESRSDDGGLILSVRDNGIGIPEDQHDRVFEPFGQARHDAMVAHEGIGLGLSLSRKIMELHGGTLELESVEGVGTTVIMTMPPERCVESGDQGLQASA